MREGTEGTYAGEGGFLRKGTPQEVATQGSVNTRFGVERCVRFAFDLAESRPRRHLTLVHKTNVLTFSGDLWQRTFDQVALEYPDVTTAYYHIDAACIYCVESPQRYDVVVTDNLPAGEIGVRRDEPVHARERDHDSPGVRNRPAAQSRSGPSSNDRRIVALGQLNHRHHVRGGARKDHQIRPGLVHAAVIFIQRQIFGAPQVSLGSQ